MRPIARTVGIVVVLGLAASLMTPLCGCSTRVGAYYVSMRSDLRNLHSLQEIYFSDHQAFSDDHVALSFVPSEGVTVTILAAGAAGWAARATHRAHESGAGYLTGADCVAAQGTVPVLPSTRIKGRSPTPAQPVVCDQDGWRVGQSPWARWRWSVSD